MNDFERFEDLLKLAKEMFDVTECHLFIDGRIEISGLDGEKAMQLSLGGCRNAS